jgi:hypothetical protein
VDNGPLESSKYAIAQSKVSSKLPGAAVALMTRSIGARFALPDLVICRAIVHQAGGQLAADYILEGSVLP